MSAWTLRRAPFTLLLVLALAAAMLPGTTARADVNKDPREVTAVASPTASNTVEVRWQAPIETANLTGYVILLQRRASDEWQDQATRSVTVAGTLVFDGLQNGLTYRARITAVYGNGLGGSALSGSAVPYGRPARPTIDLAQPGDAVVVLDWSPPADNGRPITGYTISVDPGGPVDLVANVTSFEVDGLENDEEYSFQLTATNLRGDSLPSQVLTAIPVAGGNGEGEGNGGNGAEGPGDDGPSTDDGDEDSASDEGEANDEDGGSSEEESDAEIDPDGESAADDDSDENATDDGQDSPSEDSSDGGPGQEDEQQGGGQPSDDPSDDEGPVDAPDDGETPHGPGEPGDAPTSFADVSAGSTHADNIDRLVASGITLGCGEDRFCPADPVTRQQMATFLVRALGLAPSEEQPFIDVVEGSTHDASIRALAASRITRGCTEDRFCPADPVLRGQMASFLMRGLALTAGEDPPVFADVPAEHPHREGIDALAEAEVTLGCAPELFCPDLVVTREQMASFLVRALDL